jgi:Uma2 family endonuclease
VATGTLISEEEYLRSSYEPDCEYEDGVLIERNAGTIKHSDLQTLLSAYFVQRRKVWGVRVLVEARVKIRPGKYMIPDICVFPAPGPDGNTELVITNAPLLWIEILSPEDRHTRVIKKTKDILAFGCQYVWVIDPTTLESVLHTAQGSTVVDDGILRLPATEIVVPLNEVVAD